MIFVAFMLLKTTKLNISIVDSLICIVYVFGGVGSIFQLGGLSSLRALSSSEVYGRRKFCEGKDYFAGKIFAAWSFGGISAQENFEIFTPKMPFPAF